MKMLRYATFAGLLFAAAPAFAQWQVPTHSVPVGEGIGVTGFNSAVPSAAGLPLVSNGAAADPSFQATPFVKDSTSQTVTCAFYSSQRIATGLITYTLPRANTCFSSFGFWIYALPGTGTVTIAPNASDNFYGLGAGVSTTLQAGAWTRLTTDAGSSGVWYLNGSGNLGEAMATTLTAGDGSTTDRSGLSVIWIARTETLTGASAVSHSFSDSSTINFNTNGAVGSASYDDQTIIAGTGTVNHHASYQSFASYDGSSTLSLLETINSSPQVNGTGTVSIVAHFNIQDVSVSGGGSVGTQYGIFCPVLVHAAANECGLLESPLEMRAHIIAGGAAPVATSCGTSPNVDGDDLSGTIVTGAGTPTGCVVTFNAPYVSAPSCNLAWASGALASMSWVESNIAITITQTGASNTRIKYKCMASAGG